MYLSKERWVIGPNPAFLFLLCFLYIYVPGLQLSDSEIAYYYGENILFQAKMLTLVALVVYLLMLSVFYRIVTPIKIIRDFSLRSEELQRVAKILVLSGFLAIAYEIFFEVGFGAFFSNSRGVAIGIEVSGYLRVVQALLIPGLTLYYFLFFRNKVNDHRFLLLVLATIIALLFYFYLGSRSRVIAIFLAVYIGYYFGFGKSPSPLKLFLAFVVLFVMVSFIAENRQNFVNFQVAWGERSFFEALYDSILSSGPLAFARSSELGLTLEVLKFVPDFHGYNYGYEFLQFFTHAIPSSIWEDKPYPRSETWSDLHILAGTSNWWVMNVSKPFVAGPAPGFLASWWYIGGLLGVFVGIAVHSLIFVKITKTLKLATSTTKGGGILLLPFVAIGFSDAVSHPFVWIYSAPLIFISLFVALLITRLRVIR